MPLRQTTILNMYMMKQFTKLFITTLMICSYIMADAQVVDNPLGGEDDKASNTSDNSDPYNRSTPRGTLNGFLLSLSYNDYVRASKYIDFSGYEHTENDSLIKRHVRQFESLLDKHGILSPVSIINQDNEGKTNDGLSINFDKVGSVKLNDNSVPIFLERVKFSEDQKQWLISSETWLKVVAYIDSKDDLYLNPLERDGFLSSNVFGVPLSDWLKMIALAIISYLMAWLATFLIKSLVRLIWKNYKENKYGDLLKTLLVPLRLVLAVAILVTLSRALGLSIIVRQAFSVVNLIALWTAFFIFIWLLINTLSSYGEERLKERNSYAGLSAVSFLKNSAKFTVIVIAVLIVFNTLGYNVTAGIAALGVGGIALALGAQKTVENIVGGLTVVFDQPVNVGDFCKFGDTLGTVEKIGMRSTRIRTLERTIVTVPNAEFSSQLIENFTKRDQFLFLTKIGLRYETTSDQMRYILVELRKILYAHPKVDPNPARVSFLGYGSDALTVEFFAYINATDYSDFLSIQEDINFRIAKVIEDSGSGFAFPSQTIYLSQDDGLSEDKQEAISKKVKEWKEKGELHIPDFDQETIQNIKNSLDYPNDGASIKKEH